MEPFKIKIKKTHPEAVIPTFASSGAVGLDLASLDDDFWAYPLGPLGSQYEIWCNPCRVGTGIALQIPEGWEGQIRPRSGWSSEGIVVIPGTIDWDYRGEISVLIYNVSTKPINIPRGSRIAQLVFQRCIPRNSWQFEEVDQLDDDTTRGTNGFGSTGL